MRGSSLLISGMKNCVSAYLDPDTNPCLYLFQGQKLDADLVQKPQPDVFYDCQNPYPDPHHYQQSVPSAGSVTKSQTMSLT